MKVLKGIVIDGNGGPAIEKGAVAIVGNRIKYVGEALALPEEFAGAEVYEIAGGAILPGLIEAHVHMSWGGANSINWINYTPQLEMARTLKNLAFLRNEGYTAIRDMGSGCVFLKAAVQEGLLDLPRIFAAGLPDQRAKRR